MAKKKKIEIPGGWFPVSKDMLRSEVFKSLSDKSIAIYLYLLNDIKKNGQNDVSLTFEQAKDNNRCVSKIPFNKSKKELVEKGFLDSLDGGGMGKKAAFKLSNRWKKYNTELFIEKGYKKGFCAAKGFKRK